MNTIRAFIAIEIPEPVQAQLDQVINRLKDQDRAHVLRWTQARNIHITLKFLGETPITKVEPLSQALAAQASRLAPFDIRLGGLGVFPSAAMPRVLWLGMGASPLLISLQKGIEQSVLSLGFPAEERPYTPHLTLARLAQNAAREDVAQVGALVTTWIKSAPETVGTIQVDQVHIFRSDLRPSGPIYTRIASAPLAAGTGKLPRP